MTHPKSLAWTTRGCRIKPSRQFAASFNLQERSNSGSGETNMKLLFGGFIAIILLILYEYAVYQGIVVVMCLDTPGCTQYTADSFSSGFAHAMSLIGGLVSALVIAELAVTKPGETPVARVIGGLSAGAVLNWTLIIVTMIYLVVWVVAGLAAYVVGTMWYPGKLQPLTDLGQSWLGLAVAAAYSYFGISPAGDPPVAGANKKI
jgi:hypothetical protein